MAAVPSLRRRLADVPGVPAGHRRRAIATALAAKLSDTSGAAFGIANHVFTTLFILFRVVGAGVSVYHDAGARCWPA